VAVCLLLSAHRAVIFAIAQLSCLSTGQEIGWENVSKMTDFVSSGELSINSVDQPLRFMNASAAAAAAGSATSRLMTNLQ